MIRCWASRFVVLRDAMALSNSSIASIGRPSPRSWRAAIPFSRRPRMLLVQRLASLMLLAIIACAGAFVAPAIIRAVGSPQGANCAPLGGSERSECGGTTDYAREERWAAEIVPSLVVGDAIYLSTPERARVLSILTRS